VVLLVQRLHAASQVMMESLGRIVENLVEQEILLQRRQLQRPLHLFYVQPQRVASQATMESLESIALCRAG